jgi:hypothetical protein
MHRHLFVSLTVVALLMLSGCVNMDTLLRDPPSGNAVPDRPVDDPLILENDPRISDQREVRFRYYHSYDTGTSRTIRYVVLLDKYIEDPGSGEYVLHPDGFTPDLQYFVRDLRLVIVTSPERRGAFLMYDLEGPPPVPEFREIVFTVGEHTRTSPVTVTGRQWARENRVRETGHAEVGINLLIRAAVTADTLAFRLVTGDERSDISVMVRGYEQEALLYALRSMLMYDTELRPEPAEIDGLLLEMLAASEAAASEAEAAEAEAAEAAEAREHAEAAADTPAAEGDAPVEVEELPLED